MSRTVLTGLTAGLIATLPAVAFSQSNRMAPHGQGEATMASAAPR